jgi:hypothetical protein
MTAAGPITVGTTWTLILDLRAKLIQQLIITRESQQTMEIAYGANDVVPAESQAPEWIVTKSSLGIETARIPTGGQVYARMADESAGVEVNFD